MKKQEFFIEGTLGDSFIASCKLYNDKFVRIFHRTQHKYWYPEIKQIYNIFIPTADVCFTDENRKDLLEINSSCHLQTDNMEFFPVFCSTGNVIVESPYVVIQCHSGKLNGGNTKRLSTGTIQKFINNFTPEINVVLIGTDGSYGFIDNVTNCVGETTIEMAFNIIYGSDGFIGPEGLMSFFALSQKKDSIIFYRDMEALRKRVIGTPWEAYVIDLVRMDNMTY